jgi:hypothetical protein
MARFSARERLVAGMLAGLVGGIVLSAFLTLLSIMDGTDVWIGAKVAGVPLLGERALQPGFDAGAVLVGVTSHLGVSMTWGALFGLLVGGCPGTIVVVAGLAWGIVVWATMYLVVLPGLGLAPLAASVSFPRAIGQHLLFGESVAFAFLGFRGPERLAPGVAPRIDPQWTARPHGRGTAA